MKLQNYIGGEFVESAAQGLLPRTSPSTGALLYELPDSNELDAIRAIQSAYKAHERWSKAPMAARAELLLNWSRALEPHRETITAVLAQETGFPRSALLKEDWPRAQKILQYYAQAALTMTEPSLNGADGLRYMRRDPLGVVGVILPWSGGLSEFFLKVAPALVCGNSVICKPSTLASRALYEVVKALSEIGAPAGLCNLVLGRGATVGQTLVSHPGVRAVSFSGTGSVGETVAKTAAGLMKRTSLRLGSKNAAILLKDCDLTKAVAGTVVSALQWQAESPLSTPRILVHESIQSAFLDGFLTAVRGLRMGDPLEDATQIGPLITERHRHQAQRYWDLAKQEGAKALFGDEPLDLPSTLNQGHFLSPKVLKDLSNCSELHHVDFYAPIVSVQEFKYPHEAIKMANNTQFGRAATLWTQDVKLAHKVANGLQVGAVAINTALAQEPWEVQAATKNSGTSVEGGPRSFDFYTDLKTITLGLE